MTIACTRCGASCEGDIIVPPLAFGFKHNSGCGHGVGPLAVLPSSVKPKKTITDDIKTAPNDEASRKIVEKILKKDDVKIEEKPKKSKPFVEKVKSFGQHKDTTST
jgi:hypothetical protein